MGLLEVVLDPATVVVAVDPGKVMNRVWVSNGAGLLEEPISLIGRPVGDRDIGEDARRAWRGAGVRDRGDREPASGMGRGAGAAPSGCASVVRALGDQGCSHAARIGAVQDR